ncbi:hypothetical protein Taro_053867 [Colocasia esculenta]|uniref:Uncharacterized protein n=1 Tax=Colocasia esculenta TaxID=4460 RepID=A0A843XMD6_COLES|nr:hypothetical protein [Colocasia esculenta]
MTCINRPLGVDQGVRRRPCERDGPIGRILRSRRDIPNRRDLFATRRFVAIVLPDLTAQSHFSQHPVAFWSRPVATLAVVCRYLTRA